MGTGPILLLDGPVMMLYAPNTVRRCHYIYMLLLGLVVSVPRFVPAEDVLPSVPWLIEQLMRPHLTIPEQDHFLERIRREGARALPVLIDHLTDHRPAGTRRIGNLPGECMNLPPHQPVPSVCNGPTEIVMNMDVAAWCETLLYEIVTPAYSSPHAHGADRGKAGGERPFIVKNWKEWWARYQRKNLVALHVMARTLIDRFWQRGWEKGPVEWK